MPRVSGGSLGHRTSTFKSVESQRRLLEADRRWLVKSILRAVAAVFALIGFSVFAAAIPKWDENFYWAGDVPSMGDWQDGLPCGVLVVSFCYSCVMLFFMLSRKMAINPIIPLVVDLLVWVALVAAITYSAGLGLFDFWNTTIEEADGPYYWGVIKSIGSLELAGVVFACLVWAIHFTLFVLACIDTHKWRKARKANKNYNNGSSPRALEHHDFVRSENEHGAGVTVPPPVYDDSGLGKDIELSPTSPTAREFV